MVCVIAFASWGDRFIRVIRYIIMIVCVFFVGFLFFDVGQGGVFVVSSGDVLTLIVFNIKNRLSFLY